MTHLSDLQNRYDIAIVGGRCAGSAAAIALAGMGYRILLMERAAMPSDTLSTHVLWPDGIAALRRLGVLDSVLATGAPPVHHFQLFRGGEPVVAQIQPFDGIDYLLCPRRIQLDGILFATAAKHHMIDAVDETRLTGLVWHGEQVTGIEVAIGDERRSIAADLVVGADGRNSMVARLTGAGEYDVVPPGRYWYYAYFSGARPPGPPALIESDTETDTVASMPTNDDLQMVIYGAFEEDFAEFKRDYQANFLNRVRAHYVGEAMLANAELATPVYGFAGIRGYYRTAFGPGWALAGDAVHQKSPLVARGVNEALRGGEWLADALADGISSDALDRYAEALWTRTETKARTARMLDRPDRYMTAEQGAVLGEATGTPDGLSEFLRIQYDDRVTFDGYFGETNAVMGR